MRRDHKDGKGKTFTIRTKVLGAVLFGICLTTPEGVYTVAQKSVLWLQTVWFATLATIFGAQ